MEKTIGNLYYISPCASLRVIKEDHAYVSEWATERQTKHSVKLMVSISCLQALAVLGERTTPAIAIVNRYLSAVYSYLIGHKDIIALCSPGTVTQIKNTIELLRKTCEDVEAYCLQVQLNVREAQGNKTGHEMVQQALDMADSSHDNPLFVFNAGTSGQKHAYLALMNLADIPEKDRMISKELNTLIEAIC